MEDEKPRETQFHKILKSGCQLEASRLRTAERLTNLIAINCIVSWRIFWMTMLNRVAPEADPRLALTPSEIKVLDRLHPFPQAQGATEKRQLSDYLQRLAKLGGYLARKGDPPPGNIVMWRGLTRLTDILLGAKLAGGIVGN